MTNDKEVQEEKNLNVPGSNLTVTVKEESNLNLNPVKE
jgi:hypothetical protein